MGGRSGREVEREVREGSLSGKFEREVCEGGQGGHP